MAAKLQCEICGGKLIGKPGGIFECESCGTEYSTEWAKAKIQEIQGTVKVEGTVDVKGTVQVEGPVKVEGAANVESLIKRGYLALEDGKWDEAYRCFHYALDADPENAEAYLGNLLADIRVSRKEKMKDYKDETKILTNSNYKKVLRFGDESLVSELNGYIECIKQKSILTQDRMEAVQKATEEYQRDLNAYQEETKSVEAMRLSYVNEQIIAKKNESIKLLWDKKTEKVSAINRKILELHNRKKEEEKKLASLGVFKMKEKKEAQTTIGILFADIRKAENELRALEEEYEASVKHTSFSIEQERSALETDAAEKFAMPPKPEKPAILVQVEQEKVNKRREWRKIVGGKDVNTQILIFLGDGELHTISEAIEVLPGLLGATHPRASALFRQLMDKGLIERVSVGNVKKFRTR